jgi:peptidyl-Asp metalloendopeptidase
VRIVAKPIVPGTDLRSASAGITLALGDNKVLTATRTHLDVKPDVAIWRGLVEGSGGQVTLMQWTNGQISGTVQHDQHFYSIRPLGDRIHAIVEMSEDRMPPEHPQAMLTSSNELFGKLPGAGALVPLTRGMPRPSADARTPQKRQPPQAMPPADITIDVLVAYTPKAARHYDDIRREVIELAIDEANESFRRSNLGHVKLRLVHAHQTDYVEEGGHFTHLWRLADKGDGHMEEVHALRNKHRADVVVLIVDDAEACGLSTRVHADAEEAFAVVHHDCATTTHSVAHEIGHIIGARHDLDMDGIMTPFPYGHGYVHGTKWRDIMSYKKSCAGCPRIPVWSSPSVLVDGAPAGTAEQNNARVIAEEAVRVASFR